MALCLSPRGVCGDPHLIVRGNFDIWGSFSQDQDPGRDKADMWRTCGTHAADMQQACSRHLAVMQLTCGRHVANMYRTCGRHSTDMQQTCRRQTCGRHAADMQQTCSSIAAHISEPAELATPSTNVDQCRVLRHRASHLAGWGVPRADCLLKVSSQQCQVIFASVWSPLVPFHFQDLSFRM